MIWKNINIYKRRGIGNFSDLNIFESPIDLNALSKQNLGMNRIYPLNGLGLKNSTKIFRFVSPIRT